MAETRIAIDLPLPLDVVGTLTKLIGTAYPSAVIDVKDSRRQLVLRVDSEDRKRLPGKKRVAEQIKDYEPDDPAERGDLTDIDVDGWAVAPSEEVRAAVSVMCVRMLEAAGDNYVCWEVSDREDPTKRYALSVARSKGQTPDALRKRAEARVEQLERALHVTIAHARGEVECAPEVRAQELEGARMVLDGEA